MSRTVKWACSVLRLTPPFTLRDIKKAYRSMARVHHPDKRGGSEEAFLQVQEAYEFLVDRIDHHRARRDEEREESSEPLQFGDRFEVVRLIINGEMIDPKSVRAQLCLLESEVVISLSFRPAVEPPTGDVDLLIRDPKAPDEGVGHYSFSPVQTSKNKKMMVTEVWFSPYEHRIWKTEDGFTDSPP